jgi:hypothetical protein
LPQLTSQHQEILSYAADAIALEDPHVFRRHVTWRNVPPAVLHELAAAVPEISRLLEG